MTNNYSSHFVQCYQTIIYSCLMNLSSLSTKLKLKLLNKATAVDEDTDAAPVACRQSEAGDLVPSTYPYKLTGHCSLAISLA